MTHRKLLSTLGLAAAAALICGCTPGPAGTPTPTPTPTTASATPTPTISPEEQKLEDAKARVVLMWATLDKLLMDPTSKINDLDPIVAGEELTALQILVTTVRQQEHVQVGTSLVTNQTAVAKGDTWVVTSCVDRSNAIITAKNGKPVTPAPAPRLSRANTLKVVGGYLRITEDRELGTC